MVRAMDWEISDRSVKVQRNPMTITKASVKSLEGAVAPSEMWTIRMNFRQTKIENEIFRACNTLDMVNRGSKPIQGLQDLVKITKTQERARVGIECPELTLKEKLD